MFCNSCGLCCDQKLMVKVEQLTGLDWMGAHQHDEDTK